MKGQWHGIFMTDSKEQTGKAVLQHNFVDSAPIMLLPLDTPPRDWTSIDILWCDVKRSPSLKLPDAHQGCSKVADHAGGTRQSVSDRLGA